MRGNRFPPDKPTLSTHSRHIECDNQIGGIAMHSAAANASSTGIWHCLVSKDRNTGTYIAHNLDFNLMASAPDQETAWERLKMSLKVFYEHCHEFVPKGL